VSQVAPIRQAQGDVSFDPFDLFEAQGYVQ